MHGTTPAFHCATHMQREFGFSSACQRQMLRDLGSHAESPRLSMRSAEKSTTGGRAPLRSPVKAPRKHSSDEDDQSLETSYLGLNKSHGVMNNPKEWWSPRKTSPAEKELDEDF